MEFAHNRITCHRNKYNEMKCPYGVKIYLKCIKVKGERDSHLQDKKNHMAQHPIAL